MVNGKSSRLSVTTCVTDGIQPWANYFWVSSSVKGWNCFSKFSGALQLKIVVLETPEIGFCVGAHDGEVRVVVPVCGLDPALSCSLWLYENH